MVQRLKRVVKKQYVKPNQVFSTLSEVSQTLGAVVSAFAEGDFDTAAKVATGIIRKMRAVRSTMERMEASLTSAVSVSDLSRLPVRFEKGKN